MSGKEQVQKSKSTQKREEVLEETKKTDEAEAEKLKEELDAMLDEIDSVLEENAEEFIKGYVLEGRRIDLARPLGRILQNV